MTNQISYLIICSQYISDGKVLFFNTPEEAKAEYTRRVSELLSIPNLVKDVDYEQDEYSTLFYGARNEELAARLDNINTYFRWNVRNLDSNKTHYIAEFSEEVTDASVQFVTEAEALCSYNKKVEDTLCRYNSNPIQGLVKRTHRESWKSEDFGTLFDEEIRQDGSIQAEFGFHNELFSLRMGRIKMESKSAAVSVALRLMDCDYTYTDAVVIAQCLHPDVAYEDLEVELNKYI